LRVVHDEERQQQQEKKSDCLGDCDRADRLGSYFCYCAYEQRWPDYLAHRLRDAGGGTRFMSVINAGISKAINSRPQRFPKPGEAGVGMMPPFLFGEFGTKRMAWDVLAQPGATDLIVHIGSNDLRSGVSGTALIEAFQHVAKGGKQGSTGNRTRKGRSKLDLQPKGFR
jgi:hypothetical protein